jgi:adenine-specific DNA-methyltransferase
MASKTRTYHKKKLLGQVYTPFHIVEKILKDAGFYESELDGKQILDPACGDGRFLVPIAKHIIQHSKPEQLISRLSQIHGWDIDKDAIHLCRQNLDALVKPLGISVEWNLRKCDALKQKKTKNRFHFIVGNPPYIRIQHLPETQRQFIQKEYSFCKTGSTDAYLAFFQLASMLLAADGTCGFITPNSWLTSQTGKPLRTYFEQNQHLLQVVNYGTIPVFGNAATYPAITIFSKKTVDQFRYQQCLNTDFQYNERIISFSEIQNNRPWHLSILPTEVRDGKRLGDICRISVGLTTLADSIFLFNILDIKNGIAEAVNKDGERIFLEKELLKPVIKGSKLKTPHDAVTEYILFPYSPDLTGKQRIIDEETLRKQFPKTYSYLLKVKPSLDRRDNGKPNAVAWYAFGRAQGLDSSFGKKIIFSPMNLAPNFVLYENPDVTVYSGYFIKYDGDYQALLTQLNSPRMAEYIAVAGRDFQGGYKGYNKKAIENFIITQTPD